MAKKYKTPNDEPQMANEPAVAVPVEMVQQKIHSVDFDVQVTDEWTDDFSVPSLQKPLEELKERIEKGIEEYHQGIYHTQEEVDALMKHWTEDL